MALDGAKELDILLSAFNKVLEQIVDAAEIPAISLLEGEMKHRIFNRGEATDGSAIGKYSTSDMLIGGTSFRNKTAADTFFKSNKGALPWVTIQKRRLAVLKGGYKALREAQQLRSDRVNLQYTDELFDSIGKGTFGGRTVLGFIKDAADENRMKALANEDRFNKVIFKPSEDELRMMDREIVRALDAALKGL